MNTAPECRRAVCTRTDECKQAGACMSIVDQAYEYRDFLVRTAMPTLKHILAMIDRGEPIAHIRVEVDALRQRANRTI